MNDLAISKRPDVGEIRFEVESGVLRLHLDLVNRDKAVSRADDPVQFDPHALERFKPPLGCPGNTLEAVVGLTDVVGQDGVLVGDLRVE